MSFLQPELSEYKQKVYAKDQAYYHNLIEGQSPATLFITCSDSRICPNEITQTKAGELFVIRNAGNMLPNADQVSNEGLTLEYAVTNLKVKNIVVCGHVKCGAMDALRNLDSLPKESMIYRGLNSVKQDYQNLESLSLDELIRLNVKQQIANIKTFKCVEDALNRKEINLYGMVYGFHDATLDVVCEEVTCEN